MSGFFPEQKLGLCQAMQELQLEKAKKGGAMISTCVDCEISNHEHPRGHYCPYYAMVIKNPEELAKTCDLRDLWITSRKEKKDEQHIGIGNSLK